MTLVHEEETMSIKLSLPALIAINRAFSDLSTNSTVGDTHAIDGLILAALSIKCGYAVKKEMVEQIRKALTAQGFEKIATELLGSP